MCHAALLDYSRLRGAVVAVREGREVQSRVSPGRARRHVEQLLASGWTRRGIARSAGISEHTMWRLAGPTRTFKHISLVTERRVLAVR